MTCNLSELRLQAIEKYDEKWPGKEEKKKRRNARARALSQSACRIVTKQYAMYSRPDAFDDYLSCYGKRQPVREYTEHSQGCQKFAHSATVGSRKDKRQGKGRNHMKTRKNQNEGVFCV